MAWGKDVGIKITDKQWSVISLLSYKFSSNIALKENSAQMVLESCKNF